jgi:hypothetical protein
MSDQILPMPEEAPPESVQVSGARVGKSYQGMSPWKAALLYGGAASTVMGPLGLLVGGIAGITAKKMRDNYLDEEASYQQRMYAEQSNFNTEVEQERQIADPTEARLLNYAKRVADAGWSRLMSGDQGGRQMVDNANQMIAEIINGDRQALKAENIAQAGVQRDLVTKAANDYRQQYQTHVSDFETVDAQAARIFDLTSQGDFDPNKPVFKTVLAELFSTSIGGFYRDAPDAMDAIAQGAGGLSSLGKYGATADAIINGVTTAIKSEDFKLTREDANRIAYNMRDIARKVTEARMQRLSSQTSQLDGYARKQGAVAQDSPSLLDYVSGGTKELNLLPVPDMEVSTLKPPTLGLGTKGLTKSAAEMANKFLKRQKLRPVN